MILLDMLSMQSGLSSVPQALFLTDLRAHDRTYPLQYLSLVGLGGLATGSACNMLAS